MNWRIASLANVDSYGKMLQADKQRISPNAGKI